MVSEEEPEAGQSQNTSFSRSAEKAKRKAQQRAQVKETLQVRDVYNEKCY